MGSTTSTTSDPCGGASDEDDPSSDGSCCACACECEDHLKKVPGDGTPGQRHMKAQTHEPVVTTKRTDTTGDGEERKCDLDTQSIIVGSLFLN